MKTLTDHTLLYDADCPMCRVYTGAFVSRGLLDKAGRHPYQQIQEHWVTAIDTERAQSEIALLNRRTHEVYYGLDALFFVLIHRFPLLKPVLMFKPLRWLLKRLYFFISYNRKVIAAARPAAGALHACTPAYSFKYRVLYLAFAWLFTSVVLNYYSVSLAGLIPASNFYREFAICGGQMVFQGAVLWMLRREKLMDYLGNMMTVSLIGALLLLPGLGIHRLFPALPALIFAAYFLLVAGIMLLEHLRRMGLLGLGYLPSATWVLYRVLVLCALLFL